MVDFILLCRQQSDDKSGQNSLNIFTHHACYCRQVFNPINYFNAYTDVYSMVFQQILILLFKSHVCGGGLPNMFVIIVETLSFLIG